jgi:hypothetical protein
VDRSFLFPKRGASITLDCVKHFRAAGGACILASVAVWAAFSFDQRSAAQELAAKSLAVFGTTGDPDEKQAVAEGQTQVQLFHASRYTREAFLRIALQDSIDARRLNRREQGFSISLSHGKSAETRALYQDVILPAIYNSSDPAEILEAFELMDRWSIAGTLDRSESDSLARRLVDKMLHTEDTDAIRPLANGAAMIAANMSPGATDELAWDLAIRSVEDAKSTASDARLPAMLALEHALGTDSAGKLASRLIDRMFTEEGGMARRTLALEAKDPDGKVSPQIADEIADKVADKMISEPNPIFIAAWGSVLDSLKDVIDPAKAGELANRLAPRVAGDLGYADAESLSSGWRGFAEKAAPPEAEKLVGLFTETLRLPFLDSHALRQGASFIPGLKAAPSSYAPLGEFLLARMRMESKPLVLADLGSAVAVLRTKLAQPLIEEAATILVKRMVSERDDDAIAPMASALDDLDEGLTKAKDADLAATLAERMGSERSSGALLNLAVGFIAVAQQTESGRAKTIAAPLLARIRTENSVPLLRTLAFSLGTIEDGVDPSAIRAAGARLAAMMSAETDADALRALVAGLCALKNAAGTENFEKAAAVLGGRIGLETDPADLHNQTASLHALAGYISENEFDAPAQTLVSRMLNAKKPEEVGALARSLEKIVTDLSPEASAQLASKLATRADAESSPGFLRAYGEVLGSFKQGSLDRAQVDKLDKMFSIPEAPCQVVTRVKVEERDPAFLTPAILNPLCSQDSWVRVVAAFDDITNQGIVHGELPKMDDTGDGDFKNLIAPDDDDEPSASSAATTDNALEIDFNKLSQALEPYRKKEAVQPEKLAVEGGSAGLLLAGLVLLLLSRKSETPLPRPSPLPAE